MNLTRKDVTVILHGGFWTLFFVLSIFFFSNFWPLKVAVIRAILNGLLFIAVFYVNLYYFIPVMLSRKRYAHYVLSSLALIVVFILLRIGFRDYLFGEPAPVMFKPRPYQSEFLIVSSFLFIFALSVFYKLADNHFKAAERNREIIRQRDETELRMLKSQVNPHFLFNTLNNLYTLAYTGSGKTAPAIMSLSEIMRYLIYDSAAREVPVEWEIKFLHNYIELEKLRIEDHRKIAVNVESPPAGMKIAPLIFIPFIENAFKHSMIDSDPEGYIQIFLTFRQGEIFLSIENSRPSGRPEPDTGGFGLKGIKSRLSLIYPGKYALDIRETETNFTVELSLSL